MPASMTMMSSPYRSAIEFIPNSPSPPRGITCSLRSAIETRSLSVTRKVSYTSAWLARREISRVRGRSKKPALVCKIHDRTSRYARYWRAQAAIAIDERLGFRT